LKTEIADELGLFGVEGESITLSTRFGTIAGSLVQTPVTFLADDGDSLRVGATVFISADWPHKARTFLGYSGLEDASAQRRPERILEPDRNGKLAADFPL